MVTNTNEKNEELLKIFLKCEQSWAEYCPTINTSIENNNVKIAREIAAIWGVKSGFFRLKQKLVSQGNNNYI